MDNILTVTGDTGELVSFDSHLVTCSGDKNRSERINVASRTTRLATSLSPACWCMRGCSMCATTTTTCSTSVTAASASDILTGRRFSMRCEQVGFTIAIGVAGKQMYEGTVTTGKIHAGSAWRGRRRSGPAGQLVALTAALVRRLAGCWQRRPASPALPA